MPGALARRSCGKLLLEGSCSNAPLGLCIPGPCLAAASSNGGRATLALPWNMNNGLLAAQSHPTGCIALVASHCPPENQSYACECNSFERLPLENRQRMHSLCILPLHTEPQEPVQDGALEIVGKGTLPDVGIL